MDKQAPSADFQEKNQINYRVQARYNFLMERHEHGHYETMFNCVHEELKLQQEHHDEAIRAAELRGIKAGLDAAAVTCNQECLDTAEYEGSDEWKGGSVHASLQCRDTIRAIDPATVQCKGE